MDDLQRNKTNVNNLVFDNTFAFDVEPSVGSLIVLACCSRGSPTFTAPTGFVEDVASTENDDRVSIFSKVYEGEGNSFLVSRSQSFSDFEIFGFELPEGAEFDIGDTSGVTGESLAVGDITITHDDSFLITGIQWSGNITVPAVTNSFTLFGGDPRQEAATRGVVAVGSYGTTWSWTTSRITGSALASYGVSTAIDASGVLNSSGQIQASGARIFDGLGGLLTTDADLTGAAEVVTAIEASGLLVGSADLLGSAGVLVEGNGQLQADADAIAAGQMLLDGSGALTATGRLIVILFSGPQIHLIGRYEPEINLRGSM